MKTVFITGGTGFIGKQTVINLLNIYSGIRIIILSRNDHNDTDQIKYIKGSIDDEKLINKIMEKYTPDTLIHLAWDVSISGYEKDSANFAWVKRSKNLAESFLKKGGRNIICSGTCFEYGSNRSELLYEDMSCMPDTLYGECKLKAYDEISRLCSIYDARLVWGRIFFPYGPKEVKRKFVTGVIDTIKNGKRFECHFPNNKYDYIYIYDVAESISQLAGNKNCSGVYNICTGVPIKLGKIVETIAERLGTTNYIDYGIDGEGAFLVGSRDKLNCLGIDLKYEFSEGLETYFQ